MITKKTNPKKRSKKNTKFLFIDLDKTLIDTDAFVIITKALLKKKIFTKKKYFKIAELLIKHILSTVFIPKKFVHGFTLYKGIQVKEVEETIKKEKKNLINHLYPSSKRYIESMKKKGFKIILVTGTFSKVGELMAKHLKLDGYLGSELEITAINNIKYYTGRTLNGTLRGNEKSKEVKRIYKKELKNSITASDSIIDQSFLELSKNPIAINPDKHLLKLAKKNKWKILYLDNKNYLK